MMTGLCFYLVGIFVDCAYEFFLYFYCLIVLVPTTLFGRAEVLGRYMHVCLAASVMSDSL